MYMYKDIGSGVAMDLDVNIDIHMDKDKDMIKKFLKMKTCIKLVMNILNKSDTY